MAKKSKNRAVVISALRELVVEEFDRMVKAGDVDDLVCDMTSTILDRASDRLTAPSRTKPRSRAAKPQDVDTRTAAGRGVYDNNVMSAVEGGADSAAKVRAKVGGSPLQARTALARLVSAGRLETTGKARGTRYHVSE